jgi:hypothetical protein
VLNVLARVLAGVQPEGAAPESGGGVQRGAGSGQVKSKVLAVPCLLLLSSCIHLLFTESHDLSTNTPQTLDLKFKVRLMLRSPWS